MTRISHFCSCPRWPKTSPCSSFLFTEVVLLTEIYHMQASLKDLKDFWVKKKKKRLKIKLLPKQTQSEFNTPPDGLSTHLWRKTKTADLQKHQIPETLPCISSGRISGVKITCDLKVCQTTFSTVWQKLHQKKVSKQEFNLWTFVQTSNFLATLPPCLMKPDQSTEDRWGNHDRTGQTRHTTSHCWHVINGKIQTDIVCTLSPSQGVWD